VSFGLHGGGDATITACNELHHYKTYSVSSSISYSGSVSPIPSGVWDVKLHVKICQGGAFVDYEKIVATRNKHTGAFSGTFTAPPGGLYYARADLYVNGNDTAQSDHVHFETR
jgi:hypothetical protein